jgi:glycosyltransferase involved in cell wall biosynthesis
VGQTAAVSRPAKPAVTVWVRSDPPPASAGADLVTPADVKGLLRSGELLRRVGRYGTGVVETTDIHLPRAPFLSTTVARLMAPRQVVLRGADGAEAAVGPGRHLLEAARFTRDLMTVPAVTRAEARQLATLPPAPAGHRARGAGRPVYVRTDLDVGLQAGGSVAHVAGVLNGLDALGLAPRFLTPQAMPGVRPSVEVRLLPRARRFLDFPATSVRHHNLLHLRHLETMLAGTDISWLYHRYSLGSFSAGLAAHRLSVPLVLEYNGSEVWARRFWSAAGGEGSTDAKVEQAMLRAADVVVVVSEPLRQELVERGVEDRRILVNPNGVDTDRYNPDVDGEGTRRRLGIDGRTVIGFIGTFGRWHGAEVLAQAYRELWRRKPEVAATTHLLMIGDGPMMPEVRRRMDGLESVTVTGTVPQDQGPAFLAACDILVAPHVPNADGSQFFGSPTKVFEYMAMGKGIVASRLGQIGEVLDDGQTALLVEPGSVEGLVTGIDRLLADPGLRNRLGAAARERATRSHTWRAHAERIAAMVTETCG